MAPTTPRTEPARNEPLPPYDDDLETPPPVARQPRQAAPEDDYEDDDLPQPQTRDDAREAIARRYREINADARANDPDFATVITDEGVVPQAEAPVAATPQPAPAADGDDPDLTLVVFGERLKRKRSELISAYDLEGLPDDVIIRAAQKEMAADQRLREAKEVADQRLAGSQTRRSGAGDVGDDEAVDQPPEPELDAANGLPADRPPQGQHQPFDAEKLDEIVQRVQFGSEDEAKQALLDYGEELRKSIPATTPEQVLDLFQQHLATQQHQTEIYNALTRFSEENPDLAGNKRLVTVGLEIAKDEMLADLRAIPGMKEEYLAPIAHDSKAVAAAHREVRLRGHSVRSFDQLLDAAGQTLRTEFNLPKPPGPGRRPGGPQSQPANPSGQARERIARKNLAPQQPRHGGVRVAPAAADRPKTAQELINEQRAARGFKVV